MHWGLSSPFLHVVDERELLSAGVGVRSMRARVARWTPAAAPSAIRSMSILIVAQMSRRKRVGQARLQTPHAAGVVGAVHVHGGSVDTAARAVECFPLCIDMRRYVIDSVSEERHGTSGTSWCLLWMQRSVCGRRYGQRMSVGERADGGGESGGLLGHGQRNECSM